jgi:acid phosphatase class B
VYDTSDERMDQTVSDESQGVPTELKIINDNEYLPDYMGMVFVGEEQDDQDHHDRVLRSDHHVRVMRSDDDSPVSAVRQDHHMRVMRGDGDHHIRVMRGDGDHHVRVMRGEADHQIS